MSYRLFINDEEVGTLLDGQKFLDYARGVGSGGSSVEPYWLGTGSWNLVFEIPDLVWRFRVNESHGTSVNWLLQGTGPNSVQLKVTGILDECSLDGARVEVVVRI